MSRLRSKELFETAKKLMPGGVNSPVRAFNSVDGDPIFFKKGKGAIVIDEDNNTYIDYCQSWGPLILGHANQDIEDKLIETIQNGTSFGAPTALENDLASLIIKNHKYIEKIRFVSSGTEAAMSAIRLARGISGKDKVVKFEGCYHGHVDSLLVEAGSGLATFGTASSAGIPQSFVNETIVLPLNDKKALEECVKEYKDQIACIAIEPIPANNGLLIQDIAFLKFLRKVCTDNDILLLFDEVISGFRVGFEGAAGLYDIQPDLLAFGKIVGGGLPVGAYASTKENMAHVAPEGPVYQAGTLSGNPVAMAAGIAQLSTCLQEGFYEEMHAKTNRLVTEILDYAKSKNYPFFMYHIGSIFWTTYLTDDIVRAAAHIKKESSSYFRKMHAFLLEQGIYVAPSAFEVGFVSQAHTQEHISETIEAFKKGLDFVFKEA